MGKKKVENEEWEQKNNGSSSFITKLTIEHVTKKIPIRMQNSTLIYRII